MSTAEDFLRWASTIAGVHDVGDMKKKLFKQTRKKIVELAGLGKKKKKKAEEGGGDGKKKKKKKKAPGEPEWDEDVRACIDGIGHKRLRNRIRRAVKNAIKAQKLAAAKNRGKKVGILAPPSILLRV